MVINDKETPARTWDNGDGSSFLNSSPGCGQNFYLGYYGILSLRAPLESSRGPERLGMLCKLKAEALQNLCSLKINHP